MGVFVIIIILGAVFWFAKTAREQAALKLAARNSFNAEHAGWDIYIAPFDEAVIAFAHDGRAIVLGTTRAHTRYACTSVASVEVLRDGTSITSTNRGSQLMGAAIGEVLLGPLGLLIGGVSGSKRTVQKVSQIGLKIIVDDRVRPIYSIDFLRVPGAGANPKDKLVKAAIQRAEHVHALLVNTIRNSSLQLAKSETQVPDRSIASRIDQLWKLKESGALTALEFDEQKAKVLSAMNERQIESH